MKYKMKQNTAAENAYVRDLERRGPLERVTRGEAAIIRASEYPEPIRRFLTRERSTLRVPLSPSLRRKLERMSRESGIAMDDLALRWIQQSLAREAS